MENTAFPNQSPYNILFCHARYNRATPTDFQTAVDLNFYDVRDEEPEEAYDAERLLKSVPFRNADMVHVYRHTTLSDPLIRTDGRGDLVVEYAEPIAGVDTLVPNGQFVSKELGSPAAQLQLLDKMKAERGILTAKNVLVPVRDDGNHGIVRFTENGAVIERYEDVLTVVRQPKPTQQVA